METLILSMKGIALLGVFGVVWDLLYAATFFLESLIATFPVYSPPMRSR